MNYQPDIEWYVIVNPAAGDGRGLDDFPVISRKLRQSNIAHTIAFTEHLYHATELTVGAVKKGYRHIIIIGGDTTLHEVVNGLFIQKEVDPTEVLLAMISIGSHNDWGRTFGLRHYSEAIEAIKEQNSFLQDVGAVTYEESHFRQTRYMVNASGAGFDAALVKIFNHFFNKGKRGKFTRIRSFFRTFFKAKAAGAKVWIDDELVYNNLLFSISVGIGKYNVYGVQMLPDADPNDGYFDVSLVKPIHIWHLLFRFKYLYDGGIYRIGHIKKYRGKKIRIQSSPEMPLQIDGELMGTTPVEFEIIPRAINIVVSKQFLERQQQAE